MRNFERVYSGQGILCAHKITLEEAKKDVAANHNEKMLLEENAPYLRTLYLRECKQVTKNKRD